jgi:hypothetical protein
MRKANFHSSYHAGAVGAPLSAAAGDAAVLPRAHEGLVVGHWNHFPTRLLHFEGTGNPKTEAFRALARKTKRKEKDREYLRQIQDRVGHRCTCKTYKRE